jgi:hypothetical protein
MMGEENKSFIGRIPSLSILMGSTILFYYAALLLTAGIFFIIGGELNHYNTILAGLASIAFYFVGGRIALLLKTRDLFTAFFLLITLVSLAILISGWFYDLSGDGQDYQQRAILELQQGWNPVQTIQQPEDIYFNQWLNHYPKAPWIVSASINQWTGNIESGKAVNSILILTVFLITFPFIHSFNINPWISIVVAACLALNPVSVYQSMSYYVDGQVASTISILIALFLFIIIRPLAFPRVWVVLLALASTLVIALNIKFTGTVYILIFSAAMLVYLYIYPRHQNIFKPTMAVVLFAVMAGFLVAGFQPFITNGLRHGNPLYPTFGSREYGYQSLMQIQTPDDLKSKGRLVKLFLSVFSRSTNDIYQPVQLKIPLSVTENEIKEFWGSDIRVGGFGPWYGGSLILTGTLVILLRFENRRKWAMTLLLAGLIVLTVLVNPESWWARYSPQLWLVPAVILLPGLMSQRRSIRLTAYLLMFVLLGNAFMVSGYYVHSNILYTKHANTTLQALAEEDEDLLIYYGPLQMVKLKLDNWQIHYKAVERYEDLPCPQLLIPFVSYSSKDCPH